MSFSIGIVGLPNIGKSTLFKSLTKQQIKIDARPFTTISPNIGIIPVPDKRLNQIAKTVKPEKVTPTSIEFIDVAGLVKNAYQGQGLGNKFLADIRNCDGLIEVIRGFEDEKVEHIEGEIDPLRDAEIVKTEFLMKDLETIDKASEKLEKEVKSGKKEEEKKLKTLFKIKEAVAKGIPVSEIDLDKEEQKIAKEYQFLTQKPKIFLLNINKPNPNLNDKLHKSLGKVLVLNVKMEEEISELPIEDQKELNIKPHLDRLILYCYDMLSLIAFYTIAKGKEARAWTLEKGAFVPKAGGKVHSDFEKKFIKAEVINWEKLIEAGTWSEAKTKGWIKTAGKDYLVQDGDVIEFKI